MVVKLYRRIKAIEILTSVSSSSCMLRRIYLPHGCWSGSAGITVFAEPPEYCSTRAPRKSELETARRTKGWPTRAIDRIG